MSQWEIIAGGVLILSCLIIIIIVSLQSSKGEGLSSAIMGAGAGGGRERGKTSDAKLATATKWFLAIFFLVTLGVTVISILNI
jgi:protein translocase, SecG subunit